MRIAYKNFTGGEVSPTLTGRYDLERYATSAQCVENMLPGLHGDAARRPGTRFVADLGEYAVLIPFSFNVDADQNFVIILSHQALRVSDGTGTLSAPVETPYAAADLLRISWAQVGDVVYLAHPGYPLHKIMRTNAEDSNGYKWSIGRVILNESIDAPAAPGVTFNGSGGSFTLRYKVVAVDADGRESLPSPSGQATNGKHPSDWVQGNSATISWKAVNGATEYNIYRESAGYYGFIGICKGGAAPKEPDETDKQALANLLATAQHFESQAASALSSYNSIKTQYDAKCGLFGESPSSDTCVNLKASCDAALATYNNLNAQAVSYRNQYNTLYGSLYPTLSFIDNNYEAKTDDTPKEDWDPFADGNHPATVSFHQQRMALGGGIKSPQTFYMSRTGDFENFRKSRPLQDDDPVEYMVASGSIDSIQWIASFGDLLIGTSGSEYKATGEGGVITPKKATITAQSYWGSAGLTPLIIGNSILHVQRHGSRVRDLFYSLEKDGYAGNDLSIMAPHLFEGHTILQWAYQQTPGSTIWCVRDDGLLLAFTYMKEHDIWGWSRQITQGRVLSAAAISGEKGDTLMLVTERRIDGQPRIFLERLADQWQDHEPVEEAYFADCGLTFRLPAPALTLEGLDHLEGCELAVLADGSPVEGCVVHQGRINLPYAASVVQAGLPYASALSCLPVEHDSQYGTSLGRQRAYGMCTARLYRSVGGKYGPDRHELYDLPFLPDHWGQAVLPYSGEVSFAPGGSWETSGSLWLVQDRPLPFRLLSLVLEVNFS